MAYTEKYVTVTGGGLHDGSSEANSWTLTEALSAVVGDRVNVKAGTYVIGSTINFSTQSGSTTNHFALRGYKTTIGDMDGIPTTVLVPGTDIPLVETPSSSYYFMVSASHACVNNMAFDNQAWVQRVYMRSIGGLVTRCQFESSGGYPALMMDGGNQYSTVNECYFHATGTAPATLVAANGSECFFGCVFDGGVSAFTSTLRFRSFFNCLFMNQTGNCLPNNGYGWCPILSCTFYNIGLDAINATATTTAPQMVMNNVFHTVGGYAVGNSGTGIFQVRNNLIYNVTSGIMQTNDWDLQAENITDASDPFVDTAGGDYRLVSASGGYGKAAAQKMPHTLVESKKDIGAFQHDDPSSSGGGSTFHPLAQ